MKPLRTKSGTVGTKLINCKSADFFLKHSLERNLDNAIVIVQLNLSSNIYIFKCN